MGFLSPVGPGTMPTVFESITRAVVKEMDTSGEMIAVRSLGDADKFRCFYLVKKRRRFFGYQYVKTNLTLKDILESEVPFDMVVPEFQGQCEVVRGFAHSCSNPLSMPHCYQPGQPVNKETVEFVCTHPYTSTWNVQESCMGRRE